MLIRSGVFILLLIAFFASVVFWVVNSEYFLLSLDKEVLFFWLIGLGLVSFLVAMKNKNKITYFDPLVFYPVIFILYCGMGAITWTNSEYETSPIVFLYYAAFLIFFILGCFFSNISIFQRRKTTVTYHINYNRMSFFLLVILIIGVSFQLLIFSKVGLAILSDNFQSERADIINQVGGFKYYFSLIIIDYIILAFVMKVVNGSYIGNKWFFVLSIFLCLALLALMGSRTRMIYPLLVPFVFLLLYRQSLITNKRLLITSSLLFLFLVVYGSLRYITGEGGELGAAISRIFLGELKLSSTTFDMVLKGVPSKLDFLGIKVIFMPFLVVLPQYSEVVVNILKEALGLTYEGGGFTPSLVGSLYIISGWQSVIIGSFIWGVVLRKLYFSMLKGSVVFILFYSYVFVYSLNVLKGGLFKDVEPFWHLFILVLVAFICVKKSNTTGEN